MNKIKAAVLRGPGELHVEDVPEPICPSGGALIRMVACAVCPSDIKMARAGHRDLSYPRILGHEAVGEVEESDSPSAEVGDIVQVWPGIACGACPSCLKGRDNLCDHQGIIGFNADGGFAELMAVPSGTVRRGGLNILPDSLEPIMATLAEPMGCCIHGQEAARVSEEDRVVIYGGGPLGLIHTAIARGTGAEALVIEPIETRRRLALMMGADRAIGIEDTARSIEEWTGGRGADVTILATPQVVVDDSLLKTMATGGRICSFSGLPRGSSEVRFDINVLHYRELLIVGAYGCTSSNDARAVEMMADGSVDLSPLINGQYRLDDVEGAFQAIENRSALKCVITEFSR